MTPSLSNRLPPVSSGISRNSSRMLKLMRSHSSALSVT